MAGVNDLFRALSDPTRREIVQLLRSGSRTAGEIAAVFPLAKSTLSAHFNILKQAGLIAGERQGTSIVYRLNTSVLHELVGVVMGWLDGGRAQRGQRGQRAQPASHAPRPAAPHVPRSVVNSVGGAVPTGTTTRTAVLRGGLLLLAARMTSRPESAAGGGQGHDSAHDAAGMVDVSAPDTAAPGVALGPAILTRRFDVAAAVRKFAH